VSNASPAEGDPVSAKIVLTKGQAPKSARWTWESTGGLELVAQPVSRQTSLPAQADGYGYACDRR